MPTRTIDRIRATSARTRIGAAVVAGVLVLGGAGLAYSLGVAGPAGNTGAASATGKQCPGQPGDPDGADDWGGCWPGPRTTGVPRGTALKRVPADATQGEGWVWNADDKVIDVIFDDVVIEGLDVNGGFYVRSTGVTIRNSRAHFLTVAPGTPANFCRPQDPAALRAIAECSVVAGVSDDSGLAPDTLRTVLTDSEIDFHGSPGHGGTCVTGRNLDVQRVDIHGCENGFDADSYVKITDSYVHDLYNSAVGDPHTDGLQSGVGRQLHVEHNVVFGFTTGCRFPNRNGSCNGTSAINIGGQRTVATVADSVVRRNLLAGGAYTMYCPMRPPKNLVVSDNRFSSVYTDSATNPADRLRVGEYGPQSYCDGTGVTAVGNRLFDHARKVTVVRPLFGQAGSGAAS